MSPLSAHSERYYRWPRQYCRSAQRYYRWDLAQRLREKEQRRGPLSGTSSGSTGRYYRSQAVPPLLLALLLPLNPTRDMQVSSRGGTSAEPEPYYRLWPWAVLPLWDSGTTACGDKRYYRSGPVVLPLWPSGTTAGANLMPFPRKQVHSKENQNCHNFCT